VEPQIVEMQDSLAPFRQQVAAENAEPRGKMSDAALAKLRSIREQDKQESVALERFRNALGSVIVNDVNLRILIERCDQPSPDTGFSLNKAGDCVRSPRPCEHLTRRVAKLSWWISAGFKLGREIDSIGLILFFSDLTPDEIGMTDSEFAQCWSEASAKKRLKYRVEHEIIKPEPKPEPQPKPEPKPRLCKAGKKCLWVKNRRAAPAVGRSDYCTPICRQSDQNRQKRLQNVAVGADSQQAA
jgi:hypothetical protein